MSIRAGVIGVAVGFSALAVRPATTVGQPAPAPDYARAKQLYDTAQSELDKGAATDAIRDFGAAYDITKDPVVFYKIALANEKAGKCDVALVYYSRYLREAKPSQKFVDITKEHVAACGGDWKAIEAGTATTTPTPTPTPNPTPSETGSGSGSGSGSVDSGSGSAAITETGSADAGSGSDVALTGLGSGSGAAEAHHSNDLPWLMIGGALAFVTAGAVFAYSANASEDDIKDLYVGLSNTTPTFDAKTAQRYQDLVDEGHRYQYLSLASFGVAAGFGVAAALIFVHDRHEEQQRLLLQPTASPTGAGASLTIKF
ncbi:MAG: hypothetical protein QM831_35185 [Kofleriaceae bacterium]